MSLTSRMAMRFKLDLTHETLRDQLQWSKADLDWVWVHARPPWDPRWEQKPTLEAAHQMAREDLKAFLAEHPEYEQTVNWWSE